MVKEEKGDLVADSHSILAWWRNHFSQLLNVRGINDVRQTEIHTAELLMFEPNAFEFELDIEKPKSHKSPGTDQIPEELIKTGGRAIRYDINKIVISVWNKEELTEECKESIIVPVYVTSDKTDCINYRSISLLPTTYKILPSILLSSLTPYALGIIEYHHRGFQRKRTTTDHMFCSRQIHEKKKWSTTNQCISTS